MADIKYWLWLLGLKGIGPVRANALLKEMRCPERVYRADEGELKAACPDLRGQDFKALSEKSLKKAEQALEKCEKTGMKVLTIQDALYPERLKNIYAPPILLFVRGALPSVDSEVAVAVVGSRRASAYGLIAAERLSHDLAKSGALVVSGMARGVDSAAARGALKAGRPTVAVFGCGADVCYPKENARLMNEIISKGAVISEFLPGTPPESGNFPIRNRVISGLSLGTVIVEAARTSGSLITAGYALEQGRDIFAVPGNIDSPGFIGANQLLKDGAKLVTSAVDVLEEYVRQYPDKLSLHGIGRKLTANAGPDRAAEAYERPSPETKDAGGASASNSHERRIVETLSKEGRLHIDELSEKTGTDIRVLSALLTMLEIRKVVRQSPGKYFELNRNPG